MSKIKKNIKSAIKWVGLSVTELLLLLMRTVGAFSLLSVVGYESIPDDPIKAFVDQYIYLMYGFATGYINSTVKEFKEMLRQV